MREFLRFGVTDFLLLTNQLSPAFERAVTDIQKSLPRDARVSLSEMPAGAGSAGALLYARELLHDRFLLCGGDSLFDANLAALLADAAVDGADVVGRVMLRRMDGASQSGGLGLQGDPISAFAGGVYLFSKQLVDHLPLIGSLEADVLPALAAAGRLHVTLADGDFRDISVAEDFVRAQSEIPALLRRRALFLDRDGVLNVNHGYVGSRDRFEWVDGALDAIQYASRSGWHVFVATNQSGVARGFYDEAAVRALLRWISDEARRTGGTIDDWRYCPFHPKATIEPYRLSHAWRKPSPGMLLDLTRAWEVEPSRAVMIGDQDTDMRAAAAAGVVGHLFTGGNLLSFIQPIIDSKF